jgi:hypothetical protein
VLPNFLVFREPSRLQFRINEVAVDADFKAAAARRHKDEPLDAAFQFSDEFVGQTDRLGFVVSKLAIDDFDLH